MCGICGIVNLDPTAQADPGLVRSMTDSLAHRGPDDMGLFLSGPVGLGHRRLSIIDLAGGKQPIFNEDRSVALVFNGEVYNYGDLAAELRGRGHVFRTRSDSETIVHAYEEYGDDCVHRLRGMFAFALWDGRRRRLLLARDRLGKKPLYYHAGTGAFSFASEIKSLLNVPGIAAEVDRDALALYLALRYVPGPRTMFRGIFKLQPGHVLILDRHGLTTRQYWDIRPGESEEPAEPLEEFLQLLNESVRLRMIAEVPVGVFLSGGLDSSAVLAAMRHNDPRPLHAFSVGYKGEHADEAQSNEFEYAAEAARANGARHHRVEISAAQFQEAIPHLVWHLDEPIADPSCIPLYFISRAARDEITVVLSGEGADEILAGYGIYRRMLGMEAVYSRLAPLCTRLAPRLAALAPGPVAAYYLRMAGLPIKARYRGVSRGLEPGAQKTLCPDGADAAPLLDELCTPYFEASRNATPLSRMLYLDTKVWLPDDLLMKADKMTMATALEQRIPFLDHKLVEFAFRLPDRFKLHRGRGKVLLRRAMQGSVPRVILDRPKQGFPVPTRSWLSGPLSGFARESLLSRDSACRTFFECGAIEQILRGNEQTAGSRHQDIWTLLVFELWHRMFIQGARPGAQPKAAEVEVTT
jgi:asparagine synthase (glutamine-hydrolysing)